MTTQQLGYFLKLAEELNYTKVAQAFFITQPTLSKQIVNLENETNIFSIDPEIRMARILDTEGSYVKGLMHRRTPDNPYVKIAVDLAMEEHRKAVEARTENN